MKMKQNRMRAARWAACASLILGLPGCSSIPGRTQAIDAGQAIQGIWISADSVAVYEIALVDGNMTVKGHSSLSGKELIIGEVTWDGNILRFASYMPSTDFKVLHENRMVDAETMSSVTTGRGTHTVIWKKQTPPSTSVL